MSESTRGKKRKLESVAPPEDRYESPVGYRSTTDAFLRFREDRPILNLFDAEIAGIIYEYWDIDWKRRRAGYQYPLHACAHKNNLKDMMFLLEIKANIEKRDRGFRALHVASQRYKLEIVKFLVNAKAKLNSKTKNGSTSLHVVVQRRWGSSISRLKIIKFLLENNANIEAIDNFGQTPIYLAASNHWIELDVVKFLVEQKANIETRNNDGETPLIGSVVSRADKSIDVVKLLVEKKADVVAKDSKGLSSEEWAVRKNLQDISKYFRSLR
mmetsp:Transcript_22616/g.33712  ORF Transcript_22616/g.33712 Transcript_22616/m.33712 type:complete len:270 (+) Transcript_22616:363-1172(+)